MKNIHIKNLLSEVPKEIRLQVYKEALEYYDKELYNILYNLITPPGLCTGYYGIGICLVLPCILWELHNYLSASPANEVWDYEDTSIAFPELSKEIISEITKASIKGDDIDYRKSLLKKWIKKLEANGGPG